MPMLIDILTEALAKEVAEFGEASPMVPQLRRQIEALKFQESKAGTKQQEEIFGACFSPCQNRK